MAPSGIRGVVIDTNGSPIEGARVALKSKKAVIVATRTDNEGDFVFNLIDSRADLVLEVSCDGFDLVEVALASTTQLPLRVVLTPHAINAEVTITATRTTTPLNETAATVVILNNRVLQTTAAATLDDTLRQVAGFSLFRRSNSRTANPTSQGVSLRATGASGASRALVLADGVPLNDPFGGWIYWDRVPRESINQVEVLLGGASHLYGNAALGGVIAVETKKPDENTLSLSTSFGNETTPIASLFASGTRSGWSGSIAAETFNTDGFVIVPEDERGLVDIAASSRSAVLTLRGGKKFSQTFDVFGTASFFGESRVNGTPLQTNRTHLRQFATGGSWLSKKVGALVVRGYGGTQVYDQNFTAIATNRNSELLTRVQRVPAQVIGASVQWSQQIKDSQTLVAGAEGREVRGASDELAYVNGKATTFVGAGGRERSGGVYVEDLIKLGSKVFLNLGGRVDHWRNFRASSVSRPITATNPTSITAFPDRTETAFSPHGSLVFRLNERVSFVGSLTRSFRVPTLNELYRSFRVGNVLTLANEKLLAERLTGGEAGVRVSSERERIKFGGNFFWNDITRPVANVTLATTPALITRQRQNLGRTISRGVELQLGSHLNRNWSVSASYLFADAFVAEFPANSALVGLQLPQVPRHQVTMQTRYENPTFLSVGLQARASSSQYDDDLNQFRLNPYFTLDAFVAKQLGRRVQVFLAVENLFNQRYEVGKTPVTTLGPPILIRGGFRLQLGSR